MLDRGVLAFAAGTLPPPPARVLEIGAGAGELAAALRESGHEVSAIDPAAEPGIGVEPVALIDATGAFDAAVAVLSLHHVEPLEASCGRLAELVLHGGPAPDRRARRHAPGRARHGLVALGEPVRGAYLHRWHLPAGLQATEEHLIGAGRLPATDARLVGVRRA